MTQELDAELEVGLFDPLVGGVHEAVRRAPPPSSRMGKNPYATAPNDCRSQWLSVNPATQIGTAFAPGSVRSTNSSTAAQSGVSIGERVPP